MTNIPNNTTTFSEPTIGDYVLATKYQDGDPCDHLMGYDMKKGRYIVVDGDGKIFRSNGFRRAEKITMEEGHKIVEMIPVIGDIPGLSLWTHLEKIRAQQ